MSKEQIDRRIVEAALACYSKFGVRKSTLEDIAKEADISRATIYRYFPNKDTLLRVVISQEISRILGRFQQELSSDTPLPERLSRGILALEEELAAHRTLHKVLELEPELLLPQLTVEGRASLAMLTSLILPAFRSAASDGEIAGSDLDEKAEWVARMTVSELGRAGLGRRFGTYDAALDWVKARLMPALVFAEVDSQRGAGIVGEKADLAEEAAISDKELSISGKDQPTSDSDNGKSPGFDPYGAIYEAALRCFARRGVSKTSIENIAKAAGYSSRASIYRHFKNKEAIVAGAIRWEAAKFFSVLRERIEGIDTFEALFIRSTKTADEFIAGHSVIPTIIEGEPELLLPHVALEAPLVVKVSSDFLTPYIEKLMLRGDIDRDNPVEVAEWIVRTILSFLVVPSRRFELGDEEDMARLAQSYLAPSLRRFRLFDSGDFKR